MPSFTLTKGTRPVLISMPHCGLKLPKDIGGNMTEIALQLADTDWHLQELYHFAHSLSVSVLQPVYSRYVIDLNRSSTNDNLYPGANTTELCPTSTFAEQPLYLQDKQPGSNEINMRLERYWHPYHCALKTELDRLKQQYGTVVLFDAHSIRSHVPRFFEGQLADLNIGTNDGASCANSLQKTIEDLFNNQSKYTVAINQRFKGGYITRAYGEPDNNVHGIQLELTQRTYMKETHPFDYSPEKSKEIQPLLKALITTLIDWAAQ